MSLMVYQEPCFFSKGACTKSSLFIYYYILLLGSLKKEKKKVFRLQKLEISDRQIGARTRARTDTKKWT